MFFCFPSCVQKPYCQQADPSGGSRQQVGVGYRLRWRGTLHKYVFAHICSCKREGIDNESCVAIVTKRKVTPSTPIPNPQMLLGKCRGGFGLCVSGHAGNWFSVNLEPWEDPPTTTHPTISSSSCRQDCSCSASLSSVCVL